MGACRAHTRTPRTAHDQEPVVVTDTEQAAAGSRRPARPSGRGAPAVSGRTSGQPGPPWRLTFSSASQTSENPAALLSVQISQSAPEKG